MLRWTEASAPASATVAGLMRGPDNELSSPELRRILLEDANGCPCLGGGIGRVWRAMPELRAGGRSKHRKLAIDAKAGDETRP